MKKTITSFDNPYIKHLTKLRTSSKYRDSCNSLIISGKKIINELSKKFKIKTLICLDSSPEIEAEMVITTSLPVLKKITGLESPDGFAAEIERPITSIQNPKKALICDHLQDPGNLGTLFRTALAFGFEVIYLLPGCVDPYNEKTIRSSKGAIFHIPHKNIDIEDLKSLKLNLFLADMGGKIAFPSLFKEPFGIILGNEGHGASKQVKDLATSVSIPMADNVDSLNVAICGSLLMYLSSSLYVG